jgi:hypothetical protein
MKKLKHIGRIKNTAAKVIVVFRTLPGESNQALVLPTATLPDMYHDSLIQLVESDQGQDAWEFGEIMFIRHFPDGRKMLTAMQQDGRLQKVSTDLINMTPTLSASIQLDQLNVIIAQQKNLPVDELCTLVAGAGKTVVKDKVPQPVVAKEVSATPLTNSDIATNYRSQADAMYKEAARLRKQADDIDPPAKKPVAKKKVVAAEESAYETTSG